MAIQLFAWGWSAFLTTYGFVFIMELLDNTQLIQVYYSSKYGRQWLLAIASWAAFVCTGLIGASFSGIRALSKYVSMGIEVFFALVLIILGVVTLAHSEIILRLWERFSSCLKTKVADPFLYSMGEGQAKQVPDSDPDVERGPISPIKHVADERGMTSIELDRTTDSAAVAEGTSDHGHDHDGDADGTAIVAASESDAHAVDESVPVVMGTAKTPRIAWWRLFILVFCTVFVLELPDKTMLMIASLAQNSNFPLSIFVGYAAAMVSQSIIALVVGKGIGSAAEKYGKYVELAVGHILFLTGAAKICIMIFVGEFTIDFGKKAIASSLSSSSI